MKGLFDLSDLLRSRARILLKVSSSYTGEAVASASARYSKEMLSRAGGKCRTVVFDGSFMATVAVLPLMDHVTKNA
jgi:hypothetical protein